MFQGVSKEISGMKFIKSENDQLNIQSVPTCKFDRKT